MSEKAKWVESLWGFTNFNFKLNLKVSAFYLEKQKCTVHPREGVSRLNFPEGFGTYYSVVSDLINLFVPLLWKCLHIFFVSLSCLVCYLSLQYLFCFVTFVCHLNLYSVWFAQVLLAHLKLFNQNFIMVWPKFKMHYFCHKSYQLTCKHMPEEKHWVSNDSMTSTNVHFYKFCLQFLAYY